MVLKPFLIVIDNYYKVIYSASIRLPSWPKLVLMLKARFLDTPFEMTTSITKLDHNRGKFHGDRSDPKVVKEMKVVALAFWGSDG